MSSHLHLNNLLIINNKEELNKKKTYMKMQVFFVGVAGFEPATSASQTRRDNRATLHPEGYL